MPLAEYECTHNVDVLAEVTKNTKPPKDRQEIYLSLMYLPSAERVTLNLIKAKNLCLPSDKEFIGKGFLD